MRELATQILLCACLSYSRALSLSWTFVLQLNVEYNQLDPLLREGEGGGDVNDPEGSGIEHIQFEGEGARKKGWVQRK